MPLVDVETRGSDVGIAWRHVSTGHDYTRVWVVVVLVLGLVLIVAATLKAFSVGAAPMTKLVIRERPSNAFAIAEIEFVLGCWLLIGSRGWMTWWLALATFLLYASIATYRAVSGAESCGCFGRVHVNPWYTAAFDVLTLVLLLGCYRTAKAQPRRRLPKWRWMTFAAACVLAVGPGTWFMLRQARAAPGDDGLPVANGVTILEPQTWIGKRFPLGRYIDIGGRLVAGRWLVVLYRSDCDHCQRAIPRYEALAQRRQKNPSVASVALVEMPPYAPAGQGLVNAGSQAALGRLSNSREWFAQTPVAILVDNGQVLKAIEGEDAESPDVLLADAGERR